MALLSIYYLNKCWKARTAEEEEVEITEAKGKGYVMEVKKVREPKSPSRLAFSSIPGLHQRLGFQEKTKRAMKSIQTKAAIEVARASGRVHEKATKRIIKLNGGKQDKSQLEVMGDGVDVVHTTSPQNELMKDTIEDEPVLFKEEEDEQLSQPQLTSPFPRYIYPINYELKGATDMDMKRKASTNSNLGSENAGSSCTSKTNEWTLLITILLLEGISASFDQLGHATTSMVMAFVALLLSIVDLIHKARKEGVTGDERSLLPCFYRHSSHNSLDWKPFGSLVEYFGIAGALWQCCYSTIACYYTRQKQDNPVKMCLLPFIFSLCVVISKLVKSHPYEPLVKPEPTPEEICF